MSAIGIDHVQFSVPDLTRGTEFLEGLGWQLQFNEPGFAREERPYFREVGKSMAFLKRGRAAIELIDGSAEPGGDRWRPLFSARVPGEVVAQVSSPRPALEVRVEELGATCLCVDDAAGDVELGEVVLSSPDPEASAEFLQCFGFRREDSASAGPALRLEFPRSIVGMELVVSIVPSVSPAGEAFVDDLGLCLIALLAKDLGQDAAELRAHGFRTTEVFDYRINGRSISNVIAYGPGGEMVELIQIGRA